MIANNQPINGFQNLFQLALSIMLAAAVAHALNILSTSIPEYDWWIWLFSCSVIFCISIIVICYMLGFFASLNELKNKDEKRKFWLKIVIIGILTLDIFAVTRFLYFLTASDITIKVSGISLLLIIALTIVLGVVLCIQSRFDKKNKSILLVIGVITTIFTFFFYIVVYYLTRGG